MNTQAKTIATTAQPVTTTTLTRTDRESHFETIWDALAGYRETCIPEGDKDYDAEWSDICTAMAWIYEDCDTGPKFDPVRASFEDQCG